MHIFFGYSSEQEALTYSRELSLGYNVGGVVVFIGAALLWYQRYINRLRKTDPEAARRELRPSAMDM